MGHHSFLSATEWLLCLLVVVIHSKFVSTFSPVGTMGGGAALVGNKIYIYGGSPNASTKGLSGSTQLVILDISQPFNLSNPPYEPLSGPQNGVPPLYFNNISPGGQGNQLLFVCGGLTSVQFFYDTTTNQWSNQSIQASPSDRNAATAVTRLYDGLIFLYGGQDGSGKDLGDVWSLSTLNMTWNTAQNGPQPFPRHLHTANLLSNGQMVIIGGLEKQQTVPLLNTVYVFDTTTFTWSDVNTDPNDIPSERYGHVSVVTQEDKIIIFGGYNEGLGYLSDFAVLDMRVNPPKWTIPSQGNIIGPGPRFASMAALAGQSDPTTVHNDIHILSTVNFTWLSTYVPDHLNYTWPDNAAPSPFPSPPTNSALIGGAAGGAVGALVIICIIAFFIYKRYLQPKIRDPKPPRYEAGMYVSPYHSETEIPKPPQQYEMPSLASSAPISPITGDVESLGRDRGISASKEFTEEEIQSDTLKPDDVFHKPYEANPPDSSMEV
ncbi:hypothetical protein BC937DRAFT_93378 [Endogone sp. FLAS-F59071]|nr:hypothetical protein BC937DRAFT_93378 [Endogone sp. FLAS-F59071]|eukprot:RUS21197.1 hypothetical protein BC937DRAFT_93378 [Endogone sp. FLAS-F59071]